MNRISSLYRVLTRRYIKGKESHHSAQPPKTTSATNVTGTASIHRIVNNKNRVTKDGITLNGVPKFDPKQGKITNAQKAAFDRLLTNARKSGK